MSTHVPSTTDEAPAEPVVAIREVHPRAIRWMHWINFPVLAIMIWSGLRIYWANDVYALGLGEDRELFAFFPEAFYDALGLGRRLARGIAFHLNVGWLLVINGAAYISYLAISGEWRHILPTRDDMADAPKVVAHDLLLPVEEPPHGRYNAAQKIAYTTVILLGMLIVATGFAIYKPTQLAWLTGLFGGYDTSRLIHFWAAIGLSSFFAVHLLQVVRAGWGNFMSMVTGFTYSAASDDETQGSA